VDVTDLDFVPTPVQSLPAAPGAHDQCFDTFNSARALGSQPTHHMAVSTVAIGRRSKRLWPLWVVLAAVIMFRTL
jgi:hypothetical protein